MTVSETEETLTVAELREALRKTALYFTTPIYLHGMKGWVIFASDVEDPVDAIMETVREGRQS